MSSESLLELTDRRKKLLSVIIQEYVRTAAPVGSQNVVQNHDLGVSAATIRNDLAALEAQGLLTHPHTSAGRIPTDAGYRFFVHNMLAETELPSMERSMIRARFQRVRQDLDQWLRLSTSVLAYTSQSAALTTAPRAVRSCYKHMELVAIQDTKVLLVLVLLDGTVKQQLLDLDEPVEQSELSRISNEINDKLTGKDASAIAGLLVQMSPFAKQVAMLVRDTIERIDSQTSTEVYRDGLFQILQAPEFAGSENMRRIVQVLEERSLLDEMAGELSESSDVQVFIGGDSRRPELRDLSLVIGRYGIDPHVTGLLGVVGPVRMPYGRNISAVRFIAGLMSEMVEELYGKS